MAQCLALLRERGIPLELETNEVRAFSLLSRLQRPTHTGPPCPSDAQQKYTLLFATPRDLKDREPFPPALYEPMKSLWADSGIQECVALATEAMLPEK